MLKIVEGILWILLALLLRRLLWCLRWLWCWHCGKTTPDPIGWLPSRGGERFAAHVRQREEEE